MSITQISFLHINLSAGFYITMQTESGENVLAEATAGERSRHKEQKT
jgi:hypothetical protein